MRTLSPEQQDAVDANTTKPCYLLAVELDSEKLWSSREDTQWNDQFFQRGFVRLGKITNDQADFSFYNEDYAHTENALNGVYLRNRVRIWWAYGPAAGADPGDPVPEPILKFDGVIYATPSIDNWIKVVSRQTPPKKFPSPRLLPPFANFLPSAGYTTQFDGAVLTINGSQQ